MIRRLLLCIALLVPALGCAVVPVGAQDPQVDPESPAGTEYQLPIDRARENARGGDTSTDDRSTGTSAAQAPLFGEGVEERKKKTSSGQNPGTDGDPATTAEIEADFGASTLQTVRAQARTPDGGGGLVPIGGGAGAVLLLGGLAGLVWRRRTMRT